MRTAVLEERVLLLDAEKRLLVRVRLGNLAQRRTRVGRVRRHVGQQHLTHDEDVVAAADRVRAREDGLQHTVGVAARGLVRARSVEAPDRELRAVREDLRLGAQPRSRLRAVDPDVLRLVGHFRSVLKPGCPAYSGQPSGPRFPARCPNVNAVLPGSPGLFQPPTPSVH